LFTRVGKLRRPESATQGPERALPTYNETVSCGCHWTTVNDQHDAERWG
jgi:hypothetical protein